MPIIASVQVRMGSSRLPGKVMKNINGKPMLGHLLDRLYLSKKLEGIVVATSINPENDVISNYCISRNTPCFRGDENDVLDRTLKALESMNATIGLEVFGDCPLIDPDIVDNIIDIFLQNEGEFDFVSNDLKTTYPPGMEVEVFKMSTLQDSNNRVKDKSIREHGTLFIRQNPDIYRLYNVSASKAHNFPELELEVDSEEDYRVVSKIFENFKDNTTFSLSDIISYLKLHPEIININKDIPRRWKEFRDDD